MSSVKGQRGVSLVEVLVAVLVLSIGLLGLATLQGRSLAMNHSAYLRSQVTSLTYDITERMRANRQAALAGGYDHALGAGTPSGTSLAEVDIRDWLGALGNTLPAGDGGIVRNGTSFTITVEWDDLRDSDNLQQFITVTNL